MYIYIYIHLINIYLHLIKSIFIIVTKGSNIKLILLKIEEIMHRI